MKTIQLIQGTEEWHQFRREKFTASDAAAMLGFSDLKSRNDLLAEKTGQATDEEVSRFKQKIFDKGHSIEALMRPVIEEQIGDELYPSVGLSDDWDRIAASFDGITMDESTIYECKQWNEGLVAYITVNQDLPPSHWPQVEQQLYVSGAKVCYFVVSDEDKKHVTLVYEPHDGRIHQVLAGWRQFETDMVGFKPVVIAEKAVAEEIDDLPAISFQLNRTTLALTTNLDLFKGAAEKLVERSKQPLENDHDFANAEAMVKTFKGAEDRIAQAVKDARGEIKDVDSFVDGLQDIAKLIREARLSTEKQVKNRKEEIKQEIATEAKNKLQAYVEEVNSSITGIRLPCPAFNFLEPQKGKRNLKSIHDAVDEALAAQKMLVNEQAARAKANMISFVENGGSDHHMLFPDLQERSIEYDLEVFTAWVKGRIATYHSEQANKAAQEKAAQAPANDNAPSYAPVADAVSRLDSVFADDAAEDTVTITLTEYNELREKAAMLEALQAAGVDNWDGYSIAIDIMRDSFASAADA